MGCRGVRMNDEEIDHFHRVMLLMGHGDLSFAVITAKCTGGTHDGENE